MLYKENASPNNPTKKEAERSVPTNTETYFDVFFFQLTNKVIAHGQAGITVFVLIGAGCVVQHVATGAYLGNDITHLELQRISFGEYHQFVCGHAFSGVLDFCLLRLNETAVCRQLDGALFQRDAQVRVDALVL